MCKDFDWYIAWNFRICCSWDDWVWKYRKKTDNFRNAGCQDSDGKTEINSTSFWFPLSSVYYLFDLVFARRNPILGYLDKCIQNWGKTIAKQFLENLECQGFDAMNETTGFLMHSSCLSVRFSFKLLLGEFKSKVAGKNGFQNQENSLLKNWPKGFGTSRNWQRRKVSFWNDIFLQKRNIVDLYRDGRVRFVVTELIVFGYRFYSHIKRESDFSDCHDFD